LLEIFELYTHIESFDIRISVAERLKILTIITSNDLNIYTSSRGLLFLIESTENKNRENHAFNVQTRPRKLNDISPPLKKIVVYFNLPQICPKANIFDNLLLSVDNIATCDLGRRP
jgi:hypothetical protein